MIKKLLAILLGVLLITSMSTPSFAKVDGKDEVKTPPANNGKVAINEYEKAKELALKSTDELSALGYSSDEIAQIKDYHKNYVKHLKKLQKLDDATLLRLGYTSDQILVLRNFDESETQATILSATMTLYSNTANFRYPDNTYTKGRLAYGWYWTGVPAFKLQDAVAVSWNDWVVESNTSYVSYYRIDGIPYTDLPATYTTDGNGTEGAGHKFNVGLQDNLYYARSGGGSFDIRSDVHAMKDFYYYMAYGHKEYTGTISFSIGKGGADASITFSGVSVIEDDHTGSYIF